MPLRAPTSLPLRFERNVGQTDPSVVYVARGRGLGALFITADGATISTAGGDAVRLRLLGAGRSARPAGRDELPTRSNYLLGADPAGWHTDVPAYTSVAIEDVYPGVSLVFREGEDGVEYDFVMAAGADPGRIAIRHEGAQPAIDADGDLVLETRTGELRHRSPVAYQLVDGHRRPVPAAFTLDDGRIGFDVGPHETGLPLVIDPTLAFSTYFGGGDWDRAWAVALDSKGSAYVTGFTASLNFRRSNRFRPRTAVRRSTHSSPSSARRARRSSIARTSAAAAATRGAQSPSTAADRRT
jgi:hypothetical protein